jgi:hypothetical protein
MGRLEFYEIVFLFILLLIGPFGPAEFVRFCLILGHGIVPFEGKIILRWVLYFAGECGLV